MQCWPFEYFEIRGNIDAIIIAVRFAPAYWGSIIECLFHLKIIIIACTPDELAVLGCTKIGILNCRRVT